MTFSKLEENQKWSLHSKFQHHGQWRASAHWTEQDLALCADKFGPDSQMQQLECGPLPLAVHIPVHLINPYVLMSYRRQVARAGRTLPRWQTACSFLTCRDSSDASLSTSSLNHYQQLVAPSDHVCFSVTHTDCGQSTAPWPHKGKCLVRRGKTLGRQFPPTAINLKNVSLEDQFTFVF